jgi:cyanophycin synthetase
VPWTAIETALADFDATPSSVPGRFNEFHIGGGTVFADYGHNPDALAALVQGLDGMAATRRSIVISAAGDRRDEDIVAQGRIVGAAFDRVLLYQDAAQRGRADGEVMALLRQGLRDAARVSEIEEIRGEFVAIDRALDHLLPGEVCLILIDQVSEALAHLAARAAEWRARHGRLRSWA